MFLCRRCLLRQVSHGHPALRRCESSALPRLDKGARMEEIIILETPKSTRQPKKTPKKRSLDVQRRLLDEYEQNRKTESSGDDLHLSSKNTLADADEINEYLDRLENLYSGSVLTPVKYGKLEKDLRSGFTTKQIRAYLAYKDIQSSRREKRRWSTVVLEDVFKVSRKEFVVSSTRMDVIELDKPTIYFLLADAGSTLRKWIEDFPGKLDVDKKNGTLAVTANSTNRKKIRELSAVFAASIDSRPLGLDIPSKWSIDKEIMKATGTFITRHENDQVQIYFYKGQELAVMQAERHIRASLGLYDERPIVALQEEEDVPTAQRTTCTMHTPLVERQFSWKRVVADLTGVQLPFYYLTSREPKPLKAVQVNARPRRTPLDTSVKLSSGESIEDMVSAHREGVDRVVITFGHVLQDETAGVSTFGTNLPGQFSALRDLVPKPSTTEQYQLVLQRPSEPDKIFVTLDTETVSGVPVYTVTKQGSKESWIRLPSHSSDLEISSTTNNALETSPALDELLLTSNLRDNEVPLTVDYMEHTWNVHLFRLSTLTFSFRGDAQSSSDGHGQVEWRKVRSRETGEERQELRISCDQTVPAAEVCKGVCTIMQSLNTQL